MIHLEEEIYGQLALADSSTELYFKGGWNFESIFGSRISYICVFEYNSADTVQIQ